MKKFFLSLILILVIHSTAHATALCVNPSGSTGCFSTIQAALDSASYGDVITVAPGVYDESIEMFPNIDLVSSAGPQNTTIRGNSQQRVVFFRDATIGRNTLLEGFTITNGKSGFGGGIEIRDASPTLRNLIVEHNEAQDGGGIAVWTSSSDSSNPIIEDSIIRNNIATVGAGGIGVRGTNSTSATIAPLIRNNQISGNSGVFGGGMRLFLNAGGTVSNNQVTSNSATMTGGGISVYCIENASTPLLQNNTVTNNTADRGGGINVFGHCTPTIENSTINDNTARLNGGGLSLTNGTNALVNNLTIKGNRADGGQGGGVLITGITATSTTATLTNNDISENYSNCDGGGIVVQGNHAAPTIQQNEIKNNSTSTSQAPCGLGGGIKYLQSAHGTLEDNDISNNQSRAGGGLHIEQSSYPLIDSNYVANNSASAEGGGIRISHGSKPTVQNNYIIHNTGADGDNVYLIHAAPYSKVEPKILHNTIVGTGGSDSDGIYIFSAGIHTEVSNNIIVANSRGLTWNAGNLPPEGTLDYNLLFDNADNYVNLSAGTNDVQENPLLGNYRGAQPSDNYQIAVGSAACNAGSSTTPNDFFNITRPQGGVPDIGAHEQVSECQAGFPDPVPTSPSNGATVTSFVPTLRWNSVPNAQSYRIQFAASSLFTNPIVDTTVSSLSYKLPAAQNNGTYYWRVKALTDDAIGAWSTTQVLTIFGPAAPDLLTPTPGRCTNDLKPTFTWLNVADADRYHIQIATDSNFSNILHDTHRFNPVFNVTSEFAFGTYYWRVASARGNNNTGDWSPIAQFQLAQVCAELSEKIYLPTILNSD